MPRDRIQELTAEERERLAAGYHEEVAHRLAERGRDDLAGWVCEQIWDFATAYVHYHRAGAFLDALRVALEGDNAANLDAALRAIEQDGRRALLDPAIELLQRRHRPMDAARLMAVRDDEPTVLARTLLKAGDRIGAARLLADAGRPRAALDVLAPDGRPPTSAAALGLAARLAWDLGDAEGAARWAQRCLRIERDDPDATALLARALGSLGHDLAAQLVAEGRNLDVRDKGVPGRYRVTGMWSSGLAGAAYVGFDRVTLQEVEIHLLLADHLEAGPVDPAVLAAVERFATSALAAAELGHPAIRPVLRIEPEAGLVVLPRAEGPDFRTLVRPPGMAGALSRARGLIAFLVEGLKAAHDRGIVHGSLMPSLIVCDAIGRPTLGPFGAHHLAGLAATHTGGLEEIMAVTAPEVRAGGAPTTASDLYAVGALLDALLWGRLRGRESIAVELPDPDTPEHELARALLAEDPDARPTIEEVLAILRRGVADVRDLGGHASSSMLGEQPRRDRASRDLESGIVVDVAETWTDALLDALCGCGNPWLQPILDRDGRRLVLAPWPEGCSTLSEQGAPHWSRLLPPDAVDYEVPELREAVVGRLRPAALVRTPSGAWMIALDDLLQR